ncbi:MAG: hypothetical protein OEX97_04185 [Acidimicrobiia bacterium]|nr:hypothetical protein [Acidimicrobiia bacterium]
MLTKLSSTVMVLTLVAGTILGGAGTAAAAGSRALWIWEGPTETAIDFAVGHGITDLYLHAPPGFSHNEMYRTFIDQAHAAGIQVLATAGHPSWTTDSRTWTDWVDEVVTFGGFDAIVFDVEPHTLPQWNSNKRKRLIRSFVDSLTSASLRAGSLPTYTTVPFWWDDPAFRTRRQFLVEQVLANSDGIIVMAYRDHASGPDGIIELSQTEVDLAASLNKQIVISVETGETNLDKVSFFEEGSTAMEAELSIVESHFASVTSYAGISIHHYGSYLSMNQ